jgi:hypothetical protein
MFATWGGIISAKRTNGLVGKKKMNPSERRVLLQKLWSYKMPKTLQ